MQVRTAGIAGGAHRADGIPLINFLPASDVHRAEVRVERVRAVFSLDDDVRAGPTACARGDDSSRDAPSTQSGSS